MKTPNQKRHGLFTILLFPALQSCLLFEDSEIKIVQPRNPEITIINPIADGVYYSNQTIELTALISDEDSPQEELRISWENQDGLIEVDITVDEDGTHSAQTLLNSGTQELILTVTDEQENSSTESVTIEVTKNTAPECFIYTQNHNISISNTLLLEAFAEDLESNESDLTVEFTSDLDGTIGTTSPNVDGIVSIETNFNTIGNHTVTMTVTDEAGSTCVDQQIWGVMNGPQVEIIYPVSGEILPTYSVIFFEGFVSDQEDSNTEINVEWESATDGTLFIMNPDEDNITSFVFQGLSYGLHTVTLTAQDSDGLFGFDSVNLIVNTTPEVSVYFGPDNPAITDTVNCNAYPSDPDPSEVEPTVEFSFQSPITGEIWQATTIEPYAASLDLSSIGAQVGNRVQCVVTVIDELGAVGHSIETIVVGDR